MPNKKKKVQKVKAKPQRNLNSKEERIILESILGKKVNNFNQEHQNQIWIVV